MKAGIILIGICGIFGIGAGNAIGQWTQLTPQHGSQVSAIAQNGSTVYAGMDNGIYVSTNDGASWARSGLTGRSVQAIYLLGTAVYAGTDTGVFVSTDEGSSWNQDGMTAISVDAFCSSAGKLFCGTISRGIFVSTIQHNDWQFAGGTGDNISALAVLNTKIIAAAKYSGLLISSDGGTTWNASNSGLTTNNVGPLLVSGGSIYVGTNAGVFASADSGANWNPKNSGWPGAQVTALASAGKELVAGTANNGIYYSPDGGITWDMTNLRTWSNPWSVTSFSILALCSSDTNTFAGLVSGGVFRSTDSGLTWSPQGLNSSPVRALAYNKGDLFEGTYHGGIFRSTDNGLTWMPRNNGITWPGVYEFAVRNSEIFTSTQTDLGGVYRSTDLGNTWTLTGLQGRQIYSLAAGNSFLVAGGPAGAAYTGGLLASTDDGTSWSQTYYSSGTSGVNSVVMGNSDLFATDISGNNVFVSTDKGHSWSTRSGVGGSCAAVIGNYVFVAAWFSNAGYLSTDNGTTWRQTVTPGDIYAMTVSGDTIYAATDHGIFASPDYGISWGNLSGNLGQAWFWSITVADGYLLAGSNTGDVWSLPLSQAVIAGLHPPALVSPPNDTAIFADTVTCIWRQVTGAVSYRIQVASDPSFTNIFADKSTGSDTAATFTGFTKGNLYYWRLDATDGSATSNWSNSWVFRILSDTVNVGGSWVQTALSGSQVQALTVLDTMLFAGTSSGGVFRSVDNGTTWSAVDSGLTCLDISSLASGGPDLYAGTYSDTGGVYLSTDDGTSWTLTGLRGRQIYTIAADSAYVLAGGPAGTSYNGGLFKSTNEGKSWTVSIDRGSSGINSAAIREPYFFATDMNDQGIFASSDQGKDWSSQFGGSCIAFVGSDVYVGDSQSAGGYLSADGGISWSRVGVEGPVTATNALMSYGNILFAAVPYSHIYMSRDEGQTWSELDDGLTDDITSFAICDGYLFAGSTAGHVWRKPLTDLVTGVNPVPIHIPSEFELDQNYPNPFNPTTTISFDLRENSHVTLQIYDMLGQKVRSYEMGMLNAGNHVQMVDMSRFASGIYFYRIDAIGSDGQSFVSSKKMVFMK